MCVCVCVCVCACVCVCVITVLLKDHLTHLNHFQAEAYTMGLCWVLGYYYQVSILWYTVVY